MPDNQKDKRILDLENNVKALKALTKLLAEEIHDLEVENEKLKHKIDYDSLDETFSPGGTD